MRFGVCNFIIKDQENWREQLHQTFQNIEAFFRSWNHPQTPSLTLKCGSLRETLPKQDIYFITSIKNTHRVQICSKNGYRDVPLSLTELEKTGRRFCSLPPGLSRKSHAYPAYGSSDPPTNSGQPGKNKLFYSGMEITQTASAIPLKCTYFYSYL